MDTRQEQIPRGILCNSCQPPGSPVFRPAALPERRRQIRRRKPQDRSIWEETRHSGFPGTEQTDDPEPIPPLPVPVESPATETVMIFRSLKAKIFILTFTPLLLFFLAIIINTHVFQKQQTVEDTYSFFRSVIGNYTSSVEKWQSGRANMVQNIARISKAELSSRNFLQATSDAYKADVYFAQDDGKIYASDQSEEEFAKGVYDDPYDPRDSSWYKNANDKVFMDDLYFEETVNDWVVSWVIRKEDGVLGLDVRIGDMDLADKNLKLPSSGKLLLVDSHDNVIIWHDNDKLRGKPTTELDPALTGGFLAQTLKDTPTKLTEFTSAAGNDMWLLGAPVGNSGWKLYICLDQDTVLASLHRSINATYAMLIFMLLAVFLAVTFFISRYITGPLSNVTRLISSMSCDHDFTGRASCETHDEIGDMTLNLNEFMDEQCRIVSSVKQIGDSILENVDSCNKVVNSVEQELKGQEDITANFARSIDEMNVATNDISTNSEEVARKVSSVHSLSSNSVDLANNAKESVNVLMNDLDSSSDAVRHMNELTSSVVAVVGTIRDIADQTNLLALNASIEAARAGEHGRGFAVVADEVRALSSRTKESIVEIENTTKDFKDGTVSVADMIRKSTDSCRITLEQVGSIVDKLNEINGHIGDVNEMTDYIANSTSVQKQNFALAEDCMSQMKDSAAKIATDMEQCTSSYGELLKDADEMKAAFEIFRLPEKA